MCVRVCMRLSVYRSQTSAASAFWAASIQSTPPKFGHDPLRGCKRKCQRNFHQGLRLWVNCGFVHVFVIYYPNNVTQEVLNDYLPPLCDLSCLLPQWDFMAVWIFLCFGSVNKGKTKFGMFLTWREHQNIWNRVAHGFKQISLTSSFLLCCS